MSRLAWIGAALLAAFALALLPHAAAGAVDDAFALEENGVARIPVLRNDISTSALPSISFDGSTVASDASGPFLLRYAGIDFYAFRNNDDGRGTANAISGWSSLAGVTPSRLTYTTGDLELVGVTGPAKVAYEVYGEVDGSIQPLRFLVDGVVVGEGTLDTATVVVDRDPASPTFGLATGYGQGRLTGPEGSSFYEEAVVASCGTGTLFFELGRFVPTRYSDPDTILITPRIVPVGFPVVSVTQALHGLVQIDADGATVTYTPVHGFDGVDHFTYTVRSCSGVEETANVAVTVSGVNDAPTASFLGPAELSPSAIGSFVDTSVDVDGTVTSWSWTFGDGATSAARDPEHAWALPGQYEVCLSVTDDDGATSAPACAAVTVLNRAPSAAFTSTAPAFTGTPVAFIDLSVDPDGSILQWSWTFGDGTGSASAFPTHAYEDNGEFDVCLAVTDDFGATDSACAVVSIMDRPPIANAAFTPAAPTTLDMVAFEDLSTDPDGEIVAWSWQFGEGNASTQRDPSHRFARGGSYVVTLTVTDDDGATDSVALQLVVTSVWAQGHATGAAIVTPTGASLLGATGGVRTEGSHVREGSDIEHDVDMLSVVGARGRVDMSPGVARASAASGHVRITLPGNHLLEIVGASASVEATCAGVTTSWSVVEMRLDGVIMAPDPLGGALALMPGAPAVAFGASRPSAEGTQTRAVTLVLNEGVEIVLAEASAGLEGCRAVELDEQQTEHDLLALTRRFRGPW